MYGCAWIKRGWERRVVWDDIKLQCWITQEPDAHGGCPVQDQPRQAALHAALPHLLQHEMLHAGMQKLSADLRQTICGKGTRNVSFMRYPADQSANCLQTGHQHSVFVA